MRRAVVGALFAFFASFVALAGGSSAPVGAQALSGASKFVALSPARVLDTRIGLGYLGPVPSGGTVTLSMLGRGGVPASGVVAVLLNVTLAEAQGPGFVQVFPTGQAAVGASSNLNIEYVGQTIPNLAIAPLGVGGMVSIYTQGGGQLIADVFGYFVADGSSRDGRYVPVFPNRLLDTRLQPPGKLGAGGAVRVQVTGRSGVPAGGTAVVVLNVTATEASDAGYVQVLPTGAGSFGSYSNLNLAPGQTIPNLVVVPVGVDGSVTVFSERGTHAIVDVFGYFTNEAAAESTEGLFIPLSPTRLLDSRGGAMPGDGSVTTVDPRGRGGIPASGVAAVFGNATATGSSGGGFVQVAPGPAASAPLGFWSNLNLERSGQTIPNAAIANVGTDGTFVLYASNATHLLFDAGGYFTRNDTVANHFPTITPIAAAVPGGGFIDINIADYAADPDGDPLHIAAFSQPGDGSVVQLSSMALRYISNPAPDRAIAFTVTVADNRGGSVAGTVSIHVTEAAANNAPTASAIDQTIVVGTFVDIDVVAVATDPDGDPLRIAGYTQPSAGFVQQTTSRSLRYFAPVLPMNVAFAYTVTDDRGGLASASVVVHIVAAGPPAAPSSLNVTPQAWSNPPNQTPTGQFSLRWNDNATNEDGYRIYQRVMGGCAVPSQRNVIATTGANATTATVSQSGYSGRSCSISLEVVAFNAAGESAPAGYSVEAPVPNAPQIVSYRRLDPNTVQVSWTHDPALGFETRSFFLGSPIGTGPNGLSTGQLTYSTSAGVGAAQAESATGYPTNNAPVITNESGGYTGTGYIGYWGYTGQGLRFTVNATNAGPQPLTFRYRQADSDNPSIRTLTINSTGAGTVAFPRTTTAWADPNGWREVTVTANLQPGNNTIELTHFGPNATNWVDLDQLTLANARPVHTATLTIPAGTNQTPYQCVFIMALNNVYYSYDFRFSATSPSVCLS